MHTIEYFIYTSWPHKKKKNLYSFKTQLNNQHGFLTELISIFNFFQLNQTNINHKLVGFKINPTS
jgi:hypothetical protein